MSRRVRITDVAPRDGLQNEPGVIPSEDKVELITTLMGIGVDEVEASSFVSPKWIPQLGDAAAVFGALAAQSPTAPPTLLSALVPNTQGMDAVVEINRRAGRHLVGKVAVFTAASETFSKRNINASIAESIRRFEPVVASAKLHKLPVRGYISCAFGCPFEGAVAPDRVAHVAQALHDLGVDELDIADTIGAADAAAVFLVLQAVVARLGERTIPRLALHLHDTMGRAAECVREGLQFGVRAFDGASGGLGGCPYASTKELRAPGNIALETLVRTVHEAGYETGVNLERARGAGALAQRIAAAARARAGAGA